MQPFGFLISLFFHTLMLVAIIFWPASAPKKINAERYLVSMVIGEMGGENLPSPVAGMRPPKDKTPSILPDSQPQAQEANKPLSNAVETPKQEAPQEMPTATPIPKTPDPTPEPPKEIAQAPKPEPPKEPETKKEPEPKKEPPKETPKTAQNAPKKNSINDALKEAQKQEKSKGASALSNALAELQGMEQMGGGGGTGSGNGGGGIYDVYAAQVILAVQPNWSMPTYSRQNLVVQVRIRLDISGTVLSAEIAEGSGRADFDASAVNAVLRTKVLPKPPTKDQQDLIISFNALELAGN